MNIKTIIGAVGAIVLGALGAGLWDLIKPLFGWLWSALLTIETLGMANLRDGLYYEAASNLFTI